MMSSSTYLNSTGAKFLVATGLLFAVASPAQADDSGTSNARSILQRSLLVSVGQASQTSGKLSQTLQGLNYSSVSVSDDQQASAWSLGYRHPFGSRFSADILYLQQGKANPSVQATLPLCKTNDQAAKETAESMPKRGQGLSALAIYHHPIGGKLAFQAGLGAMAWQSKRTATVGSSTHISKSDRVSAIV